MDTVRKAYHKKVHLYHPDKGGDEQDMRRLNESFELVKEAMGTRGRQK